MIVVPGVGKDAETVVNENGAKQSAMPYRCDLMPPLADLHVAGILAEGSKKYGEWNWLGIPAHEHINHALIHIRAFFAGDSSDDHIGHFACRAMMALEVFLRSRRRNDAAHSSYDSCSDCCSCK